MQLADADARLSLTLTPSAYQFPGATAPGDRNWLIIEGQVTQRRNVWVFSEPCLTTIEAVGLGEWLRRVADGIEPVAPPGVPSLHFAEPNVAFTLVRYGDDGAVLRVHLSLESGPPWEEGEIFAFFLEMSLSAAALREAAATWAVDLRDFPPRL